MNHYPRVGLPSGWRQLLPDGPWAGIDVSRYIVPSLESEYWFDSIFNISLVIDQPDSLQELRWGNWFDLNVRRGTVSIHPEGYHDRVRWTGSFEAVNIAVSTKWLMQQSGSGCTAMEHLLPKWKMQTQDVVLAALIRDIELDCKLGSPAGLTYSESLVLAMLYRLSAISGLMSVQKKEMIDDRSIARATDFIHQNLANHLSIEVIARAAEFEGSLCSFTRAFQKRMQINPHRYLLTARLELAKELLKKGNTNITDVSLSCGFVNLSHFSDAFKKQWGCSPTRFSGTSSRPARDQVCAPQIAVSQN